MSLWQPCPLRAAARPSVVALAATGHLRAYYIQAVIVVVLRRIEETDARAFRLHTWCNAKHLRSERAPPPPPPAARMPDGGNYTFDI
jgi:hypothetical protein